jgi:spermidine synthase
MDAGASVPSSEQTGSAADLLRRAPTGRHVLADLSGVDPALLDDDRTVQGLVSDALTAAGAQVRQIVVERFTPYGFTLVAVLSESHASVHTWPEHGTAHVDVFTCGETADPVCAVERLAAVLGATNVQLDVVPRGLTPRSVEERLSPGLTRRWQLGAVHYTARTVHQRVLIADTAHGVTLFCDEERQSAEATERVYHEALVLPAALLAARLDRVLIIGSSEGVASHLAVAAGAHLVDHVDIDRECVRACARYLPYGYTAADLDAAELHTGPIHVHYADGAAFVASCARRYDLVIVDLPDERLDTPEAPVNRLYTMPFLQRCADLLADGGVVVSQAGSPAMWRDSTLRAAWNRFDAVFAQVVPYTSTEHEWTFLMGRCTDTSDPVADMLTRLPQLAVRPISIDAAMLTARTALSRRLRAADR